MRKYLSIEECIIYEQFWNDLDSACINVDEIFYMATILYALLLKSFCRLHSSNYWFLNLLF